MMPRQIVIQFDFGLDKQPQFSRALDFNESLFRLARDDKWVSYPRDQMDRATTQRVNVKSARRLRHVLGKIEKIIKDHGLEGIARLTVVVPPN
jgi:hypothetical protein